MTNKKNQIRAAVRVGRVFNSLLHKGAVVGTLPDRHCCYVLPETERENA